MNNASFSTDRQRWQGVACLLSVSLGLLSLAGCSTDVHLSFLDPQGSVASGQRWHFYKVLAVLVVFVAIPVFVLTPFFLWRYRYGAKSARYAPR